MSSSRPSPLVEARAPLGRRQIAGIAGALAAFLLGLAGVGAVAIGDGVRVPLGDAGALVIRLEVAPVTSATTDGHR